MRDNPQRTKRILFKLHQQFDNLNVYTVPESSVSYHEPKEAEINMSEKYIVDLIHNNFDDVTDNWQA